MDILEINGVKVTHHFDIGAYRKETHIPAGVELQQHVHPHDHISVLESGTALVKFGDKEMEITGPKWIGIKNGIKHSVTAVTDVVWWCVHITDETDPEKVDTSILTGQ
jgi:quercetin dioxygenase-like cupin family protein